MDKFIPLSVPNFAGNELAYVSEAIRSEWVSTSGVYVDQFEKKVAGYVGASGAVACQNGTSGLHIALMVSDVTKGQAVIVPALTFIAAVNPVRYLGAEPIFMDCDDSLCMDPVKLKEFCVKECSFQNGELVHVKSKKAIRCLVVVHVFGNMADMEKLMAIASEYHLNVVEDATEALGTHYTSGIYAGRYAGAIGNIGVYSFNGNKIITSGGGGAIVSNNEIFLKQAKHLTTQAKSDELYYTHDEVGYNYRMTNLQAALGLAQLEELEQFIKIKKIHFEQYQAKISHMQGLSLLQVRDGIRANYWFYALYCSERFGKARDEVIGYLNKHKIQSRPIWGLIHEQKPYSGCTAYKIEKAVHYWRHVVNIPCSTKLTENEIDAVVQALLELQQGG